MRLHWKQSIFVLLTVVGFGLGCSASSSPDSQVRDDSVGGLDSSPRGDSTNSPGEGLQDSDFQETRGSDVSKTGADGPRQTYLALGDSYTIGTRVDKADRFPVQLVERLRIDFRLRVTDAHVIAGAGWTTEDLDRELDQAAIDGNTFDLVTLLIGVNNQFQGWSASKFRPEFLELLRRSISLAGDDASRVVVVSIPDYSVTPFGQNRDPEQIARELEEFNAVVRDEANAAGVHYVNITDISRRAADSPDLLASDGLHPSGEMYELWVDRLAPVARDILRASR